MAKLLNIDLLEQLLVIAMALSVITCALMQKIKGLYKTNKHIGLHSFIINVLGSIAFCITFTNVDIINSLWVGLFAFVGADSIYKALDSKLQSYSDIVKKKEPIRIDRGDSA